MKMKKRDRDNEFKVALLLASASLMSVPVKTPE